MYVSIAWADKRESLGIQNFPGPVDVMILGNKTPGLYIILLSLFGMASLVSLQGIWEIRVQSFPYLIVRHPLYFEKGLSFCGAPGLATEEDYGDC